MRNAETCRHRTVWTHQARQWAHRDSQTSQRTLPGPVRRLSDSSLFLRMSRREEFHSPMRIFALRYNSNVDRVMVDSGAAHSACPSDYANEHEVREVQRKIQFQTASGELLEHHGEKLVPYMAQDSVMGITYQVTDVEGPVAAVSSMNDGGMTVVFSPQGAWVCDETAIETSWEYRTETWESNVLDGSSESWLGASATNDGAETWTTSWTSWTDCW